MKFKLPKLKLPSLKHLPIPKRLPSLNLSFQTKQRLLRLGRVALAVLLVLTVVWACWMVWLDRCIVYTRDGAELDFSLLDASFDEGTLARPPENPVNASVYYDVGMDTEEMEALLTRLDGFYITADMLVSDIDTVRAAISVLPVGSAVMVELKNIKGNFYYTTGLEGAKTVKDVDIEAIDRLIADMNERNLYTIASIPAFRDRAYGLSHTNNGLPYIGGSGALWLDEQNCYWLNPGKSGTLSYVQNIVSELRNLGFDEVLLTDFRFPDTDQLDYSGNKTETIQKAAGNLVEKCTTDTFALSFLTTGSTVGSLSGRSRLYLENVDASAAAAAADKTKTEDPAAQVVFITDSYDTRYEEYGVLRPITSFVEDE